jgi:hypothetical protein
MASVPNTNSFTLQDVVDIVNPSSNDLIQCFQEADLIGFDPFYYSSGDNLLEFRNYSNSVSTSLSISPNPISFTGNGGNTSVVATFDSARFYVSVSKIDTGNGTSWFSISSSLISTSGDSITVSCNTLSSGSRSAKIRFVLKAIVDNSVQNTVDVVISQQVLEDPDPPR